MGDPPAPLISDCPTNCGGWLKGAGEGTRRNVPLSGRSPLSWRNPIAGRAHSDGLKHDRFLALFLLFESYDAQRPFVANRTI